MNTPQIRLNKWLVDAGVCSRREADRLIEAGQVRVDNKQASLGQKIAGNEQVVVKGRTVARNAPSKKRVYLAYHKPIGIICTSDSNAHDNIIDAVHYKERVFHVGRLDVASSGLILLTNDGNMVNPLLRAEEGHEKEYIVEVEEPLNRMFVDRMQTGVMIEGQKTRPAIVKRMGPNMFSLTLTEGRNRQIRRMCEALGYNVKHLKRIRIMHISLDNLPPGKWRHLTDEETRTLLQKLNLTKESL